MNENGVITLLAFQGSSSPRALFKGWDSHFAVVADPNLAEPILAIVSGGPLPLRYRFYSAVPLFGLLGYARRDLHSTKRSCAHQFSYCFLMSTTRLSTVGKIVILVIES